MSSGANVPKPVNVAPKPANIPPSTPASGAAVNGIFSGITDMLGLTGGRRRVSRKGRRTSKRSSRRVNRKRSSRRNRRNGRNYK